MPSTLVGLFLAMPFYVLCGFGLAFALSFRRGRAAWSWRRRGVLVAGFIATYLIGAPAFANALIHRIEHRYAPRVALDSDRHPDNLIVVLSAGWYRWRPGGGETKMSEDGWERVDAGVKLWRRIGGTLLMAGAPAPDGSDRSAAEAMADVARALGVPPSVVLVEPNSRNTYENFAFSAARLREHRGHLWLVTSALHMPRAMAVAARLGLDPVPYPCFYRAHDLTPRSFWLPSNAGPALFDDAMHEQLGMILYRWRGWVD